MIYLLLLSLGVERVCNNVAFLNLFFGLVWFICHAFGWRLSLTVLTQFHLYCDALLLTDALKCDHNAKL